MSTVKTNSSKVLRPVKRNNRPVRKLKRQNTARKVNLKKNAHKMVRDFYVISSIFLAMLMLSSGFLLYQWKDYKIVEYSKEIMQLQNDILQLKSSQARLQATINTDLLKYHRIAEVAKNKLALAPSVEEPVLLIVDKQKLEYYAQKDAEKQN